MSNEETNETIQFMRDMIESCFAYGSIEKESYQYQKYILPYKQKLGARLFNATYKQKANELNEYKVICGTYTDSDGLTYNTIVKK
jgi:hypothetical protein